MKKFNITAPQQDNLSLALSSFIKLLISTYWPIVLHLAIVLPLAFFLNIWVDEAYSLDTTSRDLGYALQQSMGFEVQPPLYFLALTLWRQLNDSIFMARLFSIGCMVATLYAIVQIAHQFLREIKPIWVLAIIALSPYSVWAAIEIRAYSLVMLLSVLLIWFFWDGYASEQPNRRSQWAYCLSAIVGCYTMYLLGFFLIANGAVLLFQRRWRMLSNYALQATCVGLTCVPLLNVILNRGSEVKAKPTLETLKASSLEIFGRLLKRILPDALLPSDEAKILVAVAVAIGLGLWVLRYFKRLNDRGQALWIITSILGLIFVAILLGSGGQLMSPRHLTILFIPLMLAGFSTFATLKPALRKKALVGVTIGLIALNTTALYHTYRPLAKVGDYIRVANYINTQEKPGEPILVFNAEAALPLAHHYKGPNPLVPLPKAEEFKVFNIRDFVFQDAQQVDRVMQQGNLNPDRVWLVKAHSCAYAGVDYNCKGLEDFVEQRYQVESFKEFQGATVRLLTRK
jgi:uncharacterized membrane protein